MTTEYVVDGPSGVDPYHASTPDSAAMIAEDRLPTGHDNGVRAFTWRGTAAERDLRIDGCQWAADQLPTPDENHGGEWVSVHTEPGDWVRITLEEADDEDTDLNPRRLATRNLPLLAIWGSVLYFYFLSTGDRGEWVTDTVIAFLIIITVHVVCIWIAVRGETA